MSTLIDIICRAFGLHHHAEPDPEQPARLQRLASAEQEAKNIANSLELARAELRVDDVRRHKGETNGLA
jgi:hypothetical protein